MCNTTSILDDASHPMDVPETTESASSAAVEEEEEEEEEYLEGVGKLIQDLFHSDKAKSSAALDVLYAYPEEDTEKWDTVTVWGGCFALVHLLKNRLDKVMKKVLACDEVAKVNELPELKTIEKTLRVIVSLTYKSETGRVGIATVGGVEAAAKIMKTFPKCRTLQEFACVVLRNSSLCSIGKAKAIESGGTAVLIAAVNNHLDSRYCCESACWALYSIVSGSKENAGLLISLGGATAVAKVRTKWPDDNDVQTPVRNLANAIASEMKDWADDK